MVSRGFHDEKWLVAARVELHGSIKSSSALNLSGPNDAKCKFIDANHSAIGIVRVPLGDRRPSWHGPTPGHGEDEKRPAILPVAKHLLRVLPFRAGSECPR